MYRRFDTGTLPTQQPLKKNEGCDEEDERAIVNKGDEE